MDKSATTLLSMMMAGLRRRQLEGMSRTFAHTLQGADLGVILHGVNSKIDLWYRLLLLNGANGIVDLDVASLLSRGRSVGLAFRVHGGRLGGDEARGGESWRR